MWVRHRSVVIVLPECFGISVGLAKKAVFYFLGLTYKIYNRVMEQAIQRPRTRSVAARQVSNAHERDLVMNQNV